MGEVLTVAMVAAHWQCSDTFVYDQIKAGRLEAMRFGSKLLRIRREAVEAYEAAMLDTAPEPPVMPQLQSAPDASTVARLIRLPHA